MTRFGCPQLRVTALWKRCFVWCVRLLARASESAPLRYITVAAVHDDFGEAR